MLSESSVDRLRSLVSVSTPQPEHRRRTNWRRILRWLGLILAVMTVLGSVVFMGVVFRNEFLQRDDTVSTAVVAKNATVTLSDDTEFAAVDTPTSTASTNSGDPFAQLRYLPAGVPDGFSRQSIVRSMNAAPVAAFVHKGVSGAPDSIVIIDSNTSPLAAGPGVPELTSTSIGEIEGVVFGAGSRVQNVAVWEHPELGPLRAWGTGLDQDSLVEFLDGLDLIGAEPAGEDWIRVDEFTGGSAGPVWRASYVSDRGQAVVIAAHATRNTDELSLLDISLCDVTRVRDSPAFSCPNLVGWSNQDGVEIVVIGDTLLTAQFAEVLREATVNDARIRGGEIAPMSVLDFEEASRLLYLPSSQQVEIESVQMHSSGETATTPAFVLVERDVPVIGDVTAVVVVSVLPDGSAEPDAIVFDDAVLPDPDSESEGEAEPDPESLDIESADSDLESTPGSSDEDAAHLIFQEAGRLLQLSATNHTQSELELLRVLLRTDDIGNLEFVSSIAESVGIERQYETAFLMPDPVVLTQGPVFGVTYITESGHTISQTVSFVPDYAPLAAALLPHDNESVAVRVGSSAGSLLVADVGQTLTWQESPGILITLKLTETSGDSDATPGLIAFANDLEPVSPQDGRLDSP